MVQNLNITCIPTYLFHLLEIVSKLFVIFIKKWEVCVNSHYNTFSGNSEKDNLQVSSIFQMVLE